MLWVILGIIGGLVLYHMVSGAIAGKYRVRWYQWILGVAAAALFLLTIQNYGALNEELEPSAAGLIWLVFGLPAVILAALTWVIPLAVPTVTKLRAGRQASAPAKAAQRG